MGLYRRKDSKVWWMAFTVDGMQYQRSTLTADRRLAEKIYGKILTEIQEGRWFEVDYARKMRLRDMVERYEQEYTEKKDYYQKARDKSIFKHLKAYFGEDATLKEVGQKVGSYQAWREGQKTNRRKRPDSGTIRKELSILRRMFNIARKQWKWRVENPVEDIELPPDSEERVRYLERDEFIRFVENLNAAPEAWLKPLVEVTLATGLRLGNIIKLQKAEVKLEQRVIFIAAEKMKNKEYLGNPLADSTYRILSNLIKTDKTGCPHVFHDAGKPLYDRKVQRALKAVVKAAEIEDFRFHDLRHTYASYLRQQGADLHSIATLMGHKDLRMTKRYAHLNVEALRPSVNKLGKLLRFYDGKAKKRQVAA
ncbi:MAG: tyrosine-type recombinase/integrase [Nitrospirota bacterium]